MNIQNHRYCITNCDLIPNSVVTVPGLSGFYEVHYTVNLPERKDKVMAQRLSGQQQLQLQTGNILQYMYMETNLF